MNIYKLANIFSKKYKLTSFAFSELDYIKKDILNCYDLYVGNNSKDSPLGWMASQGEPFSKELVDVMVDLTSNIDSLTELQIFNRVNKVLDIIFNMKSDPNNGPRNFIDDSIKIRRQSDKNQRELIKRKYEGAISRISSIFEKVAKSLNKFMGENIPLKGTFVEPERMELSKQKIFNFLHTPVAESYGLTLESFEKAILENPELKSKVTTLINAIDRGHIPRDGKEVAEIVTEIMSQNQSLQFEARKDLIKDMYGKMMAKNKGSL